MILEKLILGVTLAAPIGPVSVEMIRRGLYFGGKAAFTVRIGGLFGNTLCLIATSFGLSLLSKESSILKGLSCFGTLCLIYMGIHAICRNKKFETESTPKTPSHALMAGTLLSIANPVAFVFWSGIFATDVLQTASDHSALSLLLSNSLILVGVLLWGALLSLCLEFGKRYLTPKLIHMITLLSGVGLLFFGLKYALAFVRTLS